MQTITLPSAQVINDRLCGIGQHYFAEKSGIAQDLAGKELYPVGVNLAVYLAIEDFAQYMGNPMAGRLMAMQAPDIVCALLKDHPEAIAELKASGAFE